MDNGGGESRPNGLAATGIALGFFTRLRVAPQPPMPLGQAVLGFAPAGALIGLAIGLAHGFGLAVGLPALVAALLAILGGIVLTGALHEDGLADCADALGARGQMPEDRLALLRDPRNGTYAGLALIFSVGLRVACLASLGGGLGLVALVAAHALSRAGLGSIMAHTPLARTDGVAASAGPVDAGLAQTALLIGIGLALAPGLLFSLFGALIGAALGFVAMALANGMARRAFGGYTGDTLGAVQQCGEIAILIGWALVAGVK